MHLTISLAQIDIMRGDPQRNLATVADCAAEAARRGSDWLVLPELWSTGYDLNRAAEHATPTDSGIFAAVADLARTHRLHIIGSAISRLGAGRYGNTLTWHDADGVLLAEYSKLHLFRLMQEEQYLTAGEAGQLVDSAWGRTGLAICYDLRFPELFRHYALAGAEMVVLSAEWPWPRLAHWQTLLRARAIENQQFVIACNRVGHSGPYTFFGHSAIIDPWGETILAGDENAGLLTATLDTDLVAEVRQRIPVFADRRPDLYG
jgi:predicted amidohydrolase